MTLKVIEFPGLDIGDVARGLRALANGIDAKEYGSAHNVAWVVDCGAGEIKVGMVGNSASPGPEAHFLFALGMKKLENVNGK